MKLVRNVFAIMALGAMFASTASAGQDATKSSVGNSTETTKAAPEKSENAAKMEAPKLVTPVAPKPTPASSTSHWIQFQAMDLATRFRYIDTAPGRVTDRDEQYKISAKIQFNLAPEGRTYIQTRIETGSSFASSWSNLGPGLHNREWILNVKSLSFGQKLGKHFEGQIGGIEFDRGAGTENTYADNDGWLTGYRGTFTTSGKGWLPNKLNVTVGFVGDLKTPNTFARMHRLGDGNYAQLLAQKSFTKQHEGSFEFDTLEGIGFLRGGYRWKKIPAVVFDEIQVEAVSRMTDNPSFGWSGTISKTFDKSAKWKAGITYSDIPKALYIKNGQQLLLTSDFFTLAKRLGGTFDWKPAKDWQFQFQAARRMDNTTGVTRFRAQGVLRYNFSSLLNKILP